MGAVRVAIVEDDPFIVDTLSRLIAESDGFEAVAARDSAEGLHELLAAHFPDVVLVDVRLGADDGIEAVARARRRGMRAKVVFMTAHVGQQVVRSALEVGLDGFLHKGDLAQHWQAAVEAATEGGVLFSPVVGAYIAQQAAGIDRYEERRRFQQALTQLSPLERRVLEQLPSGATVPEMARQLNFGATTVKVAIAGVIAKLGVDNRAQAGALMSRYQG